MEVLLNTGSTLMQGVIIKGGGKLTTEYKEECAVCCLNPDDFKRLKEPKKIKLKSPKWYNAVDGFWVEWLRARNLISIPSVKYTEYKK